ncbi:hypothetical protein [Flavobacterium cerinum]|uniref:Uncharacterized protein n=1 Tax=Flavobacterium cerinum TaxID=2502784 RepID=A0A3S3QDS7_9FLAO|nr:hypothetical protein [Flavobacterium cerinum]RWX01415.1 hypothetical protein EPI11_05515 [Flavobacterium cerinum]
MTTNKPLHSFHIPVMGLAYTIDSPIRVAQYGIDSVISIVDDELMEKMNAFYSKKFSLPYKEITSKMSDYRAERITAYLNTVDEIVRLKYEAFCDEMSANKQTLSNFIGMLPQKSEIKKGLQDLISGGITNVVKSFISQHLHPGAIDVNIMTKVDKANYEKKEQLPVTYNDAHAALRGFANSKLNSSLVLSAGMNPSLYSYIATFKDFFPNKNGELKKKITLKVSDFRSAMIQGSFLAKKGIWVSEYRIESGLNCGGHAFATDGLLLGPIMEEFKQRKEELIINTHQLMIKTLLNEGYAVPNEPMPLKITVQGGVGTAEEHEFFLNYYKADSVGWGSPFLLVPEATSTDTETRNLLAAAGENDFYRSAISPLGVPFNTVNGTTNDYFKNHRINNNKAGSSCPKKLLALNREYDEEGICTASRKYQQIKLDELELKKEELSAVAFEREKDAITVKSCLCVGLANASYLENDIAIKGEQQGVVICPGPNMAYFDREITLAEMIRHIYGYESVLTAKQRPNVFIKELDLYVAYLKQEVNDVFIEITKGQIKKWTAFKNNLLEGILYYQNLFGTNDYFKNEVRVIMDGLESYKKEVSNVLIPEVVVV